ncbi:MAG: ribonuclease P protein component [Beijerinckiaceae bacterium]
MAGTRPDTAALQSGPSGGLCCYGRLTKRSDFLNAAKGLRVHGAAFVLQCAPATQTHGHLDGQTDGDIAAETARAPRVGLTVSKKNGNAVKRNRIRRRLRAALAQAAQPAGNAENGQCGMDLKPGHDYVIVARPDALTHSFSGLVTGLQQAAVRIGQGKTGQGKTGQRGGAPGKRRGSGRQGGARKPPAGKTAN